MCKVPLTLLLHAFTHTFHVFRDLRAVDIVLGLPCLGDEQATLRFYTERSFTLMDGTVVETQVLDQRLECLLMSST
jgi:hypothetical protein